MRVWNFAARGQDSHQHNKGPIGLGRQTIREEQEEEAIVFLTLEAMKEIFLFQGSKTGCSHGRLSAGS